MGGRDDGGSDGSNDDNALGNHEPGSGGETANPVRHYKGDVTTYKEDVQDGAYGRADDSRDGEQGRMSGRRASAVNKRGGRRYQEDASWDSSTGEEEESEDMAADDSNLEYMDSNSELEDVFNWEVETMDVPTQVARRQLHRDNGAEEREVLAEVAGCIHMPIRVTEGDETHQASVTTKIGDR